MAESDELKRLRHQVRQMRTLNRVLMALFLIVGAVAVIGAVRTFRNSLNTSTDPTTVNANPPNPSAH